MKKTIRKTLIALCVVALVIAVSALVYFFFKSQMMFSVKDGVQYDGFGREIKPAPVFISNIIGTWFGYGWFIVDSIVGVGLVGIAYGLFRAIGALKDTENKE